MASIAWVLSWLGDPLGSSWPALVVPAAVATLPCFIGLLYEQGAFRLTGRRRSTLVPRSGRRRVAAAALLVVGAISFGLLIAHDRGSPVQIGSHYYLDNGEARVEVGPAAYEQAVQREERLVAGGVILVSGICALMLSQAPLDAAPSLDELRRLTIDPSPALDRWKRLCGYRYVGGEVPSDPDSLMARLRGTVPVAADPGSAAGRRLVRASWTVKQSWPNNVAVEIWMVGSLEQTLHATTRVRLLVLPGEAADRRAPRGLVACSLFFVFAAGLGAIALVSGSSVALVPAGWFAVVGVANVLILGSQPSRTAKRAARQIEASFGLPPG